MLRDATHRYPAHPAPSVSAHDHEISAIALCAPERAIRDTLRYVVGFRHFDVAREPMLGHNCPRIRQYAAAVATQGVDKRELVVARRVLEHRGPVEYIDGRHLFVACIRHMNGLKQCAL